MVSDSARAEFRVAVQDDEPGLVAPSRWRRFFAAIQLRGMGFACYSSSSVAERRKFL